MQKEQPFKRQNKRNHTSTKLLLVLVFFSLIFIKTPCNINAFNIEPAIQEFILELDQEQYSTIRFTNTTEKTQIFKAYSHRYNPEKEEILDEINLVKIDKQNFTLEPGETEEIEYSVAVPDNIFGGSYFSIIVVESIYEDRDLEKASFIGLNYGIGSLIIIHVQDDTDIADIFLREVETELKYKRPLNPFNTNIEYTLRNNSKYTFLPSGKLLITAKNQNPIYHEINIEETKLYPGNELTFSFKHEIDIKDIRGLTSNQIALARVGTQFSENLRETQIDLPYLNQTLTVIIGITMIIVVITTTTVIIRRQEDRKIKNLFKKRLSKKK